MILVIFSRSILFAFSISVHRSNVRKGHIKEIGGEIVLTFKYLFLFGFNKWVPQRTRLIIVDHGPRLIQILLVHSLVVSLPLLLQDTSTVILRDIGSVHVYFLFYYTN